jgi:hypothetical protein
MKGAAVDDEAIRVPGTAPEDPIVTLGSGVLGHTSFERHTDRYGAVHLTVLDSIPGELAPARTVPVPPDEDLGARILQDLAKSDARYADTAAAASEAAARRPDNRVVAFDHAPRGTAGTLVAHVIANVSAYDWGDDFPELRLPKPGERVVLGSGTLFTEKYGDAPVIGVRPDDGRADNWMDRDAISRCKDHLVRLEFERPKDSAPGPAAARRVQAPRPEGDLPRSAGRTGQVDFPMANPPGQAANEPARRPRAARTVAAAAAPQKRGR